MIITIPHLDNYQKIVCYSTKFRAITLSHNSGYTREKKVILLEDFEKNGVRFDPILAEKAQQKSWEALYQIAAEIKPGMTETEAEKLALTVIRDSGSKKLWHPPHIRFGENTVKGYREPSELDVTLQEDDIFFVDIGPIFYGHEGDCGKTFTVGNAANLRVLTNKVESIWNLVRQEWLLGRTGQELWNKAKDFAGLFDLELTPQYVKGHRISDFPHEAITRNKMFDIASVPYPNRWVLEVQVVCPILWRGAFYEDVLK